MPTPATPSACPTSNPRRAPSRDVTATGGGGQLPSGLSELIQKKLNHRQFDRYSHLSGQESASLVCTTCPSASAFSLRFITPVLLSLSEAIFNASRFLCLLTDSQTRSSLAI